MKLPIVRELTKSGRTMTGDAGRKREEFVA